MASAVAAVATVARVAAPRLAATRPLHELESLLRSKILTEERRDAFYLVDPSAVACQHDVWQRELPRVRPFYAVKCNPDPMILAELARLGTGFDCASRGEIDLVLALGVTPDRIIYANPVKCDEHMLHALRVGVNTMTFDNATELRKIARVAPSTQLVVRLTTDDKNSVCEFSSKFGATVEEAEALLGEAERLGLAVVGVSFHVGSGCRDPAVYTQALRDAEHVMNVGRLRHGMSMRLLDVGGGFPGAAGTPHGDDLPGFTDLAATIRAGLDEVFPLDGGVDVIAEPGRFYAASSATLATRIIGVRENATRRRLYVNDGVYGSFNCLYFDHAAVEAHPLPMHTPPSVLAQPDNHTLTAVFGPTCDGLDVISRDLVLPESLQTDDWLYWTNMGAYTRAAASPFNGFQLPERYQID